MGYRQLLAGVTALGIMGASAWAEGQISVTGQGSIETAPDMATLSFLVSREDREAKDAVDNMSRAARAVLSRLETAGVLGEDIQTSSLRLQPRRETRASAGNRAPRITGYMAETRITVQIRDLERLGTTIDSVVGEGANGFDWLRFGLQDPGLTEDEARRLAVADGRRKAVVYAEAAGVELGDLVSLSEGGARSIPVVMEARSLSAEGVAVAPGELTVGASVAMVYAIAE